MSRTVPRTRGTLPGVAALLVTAACGLAMAACGAGSAFHTGFDVTQGALTALQGSEGSVLDRDTLHDTTAALLSGVHISPALQGEVNNLAASTVASAMSPLTATVSALLATLRTQLLALVDGLDGPVARLSRDELNALRQQIRGVIQDTDDGLQMLIQHNTRILGETVRVELEQAINENVLRGVQQMGDRAAYGAATGLGRGLRQEVTPALGDVRRALLGQVPDTTNQSTVYALAGVLAMAVIGLGVMGWRLSHPHAKRHERTAWVSRRRSRKR